MNISEELKSITLQGDFQPKIIDFIKAARASGLVLKVNLPVAKAFEDDQEVIALFNSKIIDAFETIDRVLIYMKIVKSD